MDRGKVVHYFNPGHETAVLNASKYYHPPAHVAKMQADLAFLPAWYASEGDFVFIETPLTDDFVLFCESINLQAKAITTADFAANPEMYQNSSIDLWGISPQSVYFFETLSEKWNLSLAIPQWKDEFSFLGSRFASHKLLAGLLPHIHGMDYTILPQFYSDIETIEQLIAHSQEQLLIKSPYSSSGRGLVWLPPGKLARSERQIINGMLKKQTYVSVERALNKSMDFSMHFENTSQGETRFTGYSIFQTNVKGAYEKSLLAKQERLEKEIMNRIDADLLLQSRAALTEMMQEMYAPHYTGTIGVDMMIYKSGNSYCLHPCIEINMRKSMGYLAIRFADKYLHQESYGKFYIEYNPNSEIINQNHRQMQKQFPIIMENKRIRSGYINLCPVTDTTNYQAYIICE